MTEAEAKEAGEVLALVEWPGFKPNRSWEHVYWRDEDGETDPDGHTRYWAAGWCCKSTADHLEEMDAKIVAFAPLPRIST